MRGAGHPAGDYLNKLIRLGHRIAVCEQTEDPAEARKRGGKAVVRREVVRLVTAGTLTEDTLLAADRNNYLAAIAEIRSEPCSALASVDISTGEILGHGPGRSVPAGERDGAARDRARSWSPTRRDRGADRPDLARHGPAVTPLPRAQLHSARRRAGAPCKLHFQASQALDSFGSYSRAELPASAALLDYLRLPSRSAARLESPRQREDRRAIAAIDMAHREPIWSSPALRFRASGRGASSVRSTAPSRRAAPGC